MTVDAIAGIADAAVVGDGPFDATHTRDAVRKLSETAKAQRNENKRLESEVERLTIERNNAMRQMEWESSHAAYLKKELDRADTDRDYIQGF